MKKNKKIALLPNVITAFGLSCGLFVIFKMNSTATSAINFQELLGVTGILLLAAFADLLDGALARAIKAESEFGGIFDALADAISFGVAPVVVVLKSLSIETGSHYFFLITAAAMVFSLSGVLRLARFRVHAGVARGNDSLEKEQLKHFTGLPIPAAAAATISLNLFLFSETTSQLKISSLHQLWILTAALSLLGYCMISCWKFPSIKSLEMRVASFRTVFITVIIAALFFYGVLHHFSLVFLVIAWGYIAIALSLSIVRVIAGRKSKTLEDFEPEADELTDDF